MKAREKKIYKHAISDITGPESAWCWPSLESGLMLPTLDQFGLDVLKL